VAAVVHIALDWGSSRLRAYRLSTYGATIEERSADIGVFNVQDRAFERSLRSLIGDWLDALSTAEICAAGMIGSANGWVEAPYVRAPATVAQLRTQCVRVPFEHSAHALQIVPGVRVGAGAATDVMRGEETQIFGVLGDAQDGVFCLPGTHNKWVIVQGGRIVHFRTHFSGELYQWVSAASGIGKVLALDAPFDGVAFDEAVQRAADAPADLLNHLFQLRASVVARECSGAQSASGAQGVVIGNDVANGLSYLRRNGMRLADVHIIGAGPLCALYQRALGLHDVASVVHSQDATVKGLTRIFSDMA
jgi:2-dehydro-3-deoxygalactonokinase